MPCWAKGEVLLDLRSRGRCYRSAVADTDGAPFRAPSPSPSRAATLVPMPLRLILLAVIAAVVLGVAVASDVQAARPLRAIGPVKSPARFVLPPRPRPLTIAQRAVRIARKQLGTPYRWGGASPGRLRLLGADLLDLQPARDLAAAQRGRAVRRRALGAGVEAPAG